MLLDRLAAVHGAERDLEELYALAGPKRLALLLDELDKVVDECGSRGDKHLVVLVVVVDADSLRLITGGLGAQLFLLFKA